jgi:DNA-binding beta-propeller fold protein YncE
VTTHRRFASLGLAALTLLFVGASASSAALLVADRLSNSVYRYSNSGALLGTVLTDNVNLIQPSGVALSPDQTRLYVSSIGNNRVMQYDYNVGTGAASNPVVFADAADGLMFPNSIVFSPSGNTVYVSNLGGSGVARFNLDGSSAGAPLNGLIGGGAFFQFSGMAFAPSGELIVGAFQDFPAGTSGAVAKSNAAITSLSDFIAPSTALNGASGLLVQGFNLYVSAGFAGNIRRYNVSTGELDAGFGLSGLEFPQGMVNAPDGNGFLVGILGFVDGSGKISRYDFNGTLLGTFAINGSGGFTEATAFAVVIPEPATGGMLGVALVALVSLARRRIAG